MPSLVSSLPRVSVRTWPTAIAALALFVAWLLAWQWETVAAMVMVWHRSETFAHGFIVVPISLWLIWRRRAELALTTPSPRVWPLAVLAIAAAGWLVGSLADVVTVRQYAFVTMLISGVWATLGPRVGGAIAFPLAYLFFGVPFGEFLIPSLMEMTADFAEVALRSSGIPVHREGLFLHIPSGTWSVVEGCSGLRYLIASATLGCLYAYLTYRSYWRRAVFIVASVAVPILANWLRAYIIVMIGHLSDNKLAHGVDHLIYGWVFFGFVMLLLFWVGSYWRQDQPADVSVDEPDHVPAPIRSSGAVFGPGRARLAWVLAAGLVLVATGPLVAQAIERANVAAGVAKIALPETAGRWVRRADTLTAWRPLLTPPRESASAAFSTAGRNVGVHVAIYRDQDDRSKLVSSQNLLVRQKDKIWSSRGVDRRQVMFGNGPAVIDEDLLASPNQRLVTWRWYWIDGRLTVDDRTAKLLQLGSQLRGRGDGGAIVLVYAPYAAGDQEQAREALAAFLADAAPALDGAIRQALSPVK